MSCLRDLAWLIFASGTVCAAVLLGSMPWHVQGADWDLAKRGLALVRCESLKPIDAKNPKGDHVRRYRVVAIIEQPRSGREVSTDDTMSEPVPGDIRMGTDEGPSAYPGLVFLRLVHWGNGSLQPSGPDIVFPAKDGKEELARAKAEADAFARDITALRSAKTKSDAAAMFASLTASTPTPSGSLILEGLRFYNREGMDGYIDPGLSDQDYGNLADGFINLGMRADLPECLWDQAMRSALRVSGGLLDKHARQQLDIRVAMRLFDAYHDAVRDTKRDIEFPLRIFDYLDVCLSQPHVRSAPLLGERLARVSSDMASYAARLDKAGERAWAKHVSERRIRVLQWLSEDAKASRKRG